MKTKTTLIILDRDGVINYDSPEYIKSPDEWQPIPGSLEAIATLNRAGFRVVVATNQSGVARGHYDLETLSLIHDKFTQALATVGGYIDEIFFCPHHPDEKCLCRKPQPGLLYRIEKKYNVDLTECFFIGDSVTDMHAAIAAGCKPILVMTGNGEKTLASDPLFSTLPYFRDLAEAVEYIIKC